MNYLPTKLSGVFVVETSSRVDPRGSFERLYCAQQFSGLIGNKPIIQINRSRTTDIGAVRGMHFQYPPHAEIKVVRCMKGRIWDVAVDLRAGSSTFLQWHGEVLDPENSRGMVIPEGCAHGFQVLAQDSELLYLHTASYAPESEGGVSCRDPRLAIHWPLPITELSAKDSNHTALSAEFSGIVV